MHYRHIHDLAWDFVDAARLQLNARLDAARMNALFATLGVGDYEAAIDIVLAECAGAPIAINPELAHRLRRWVATFGEPNESAHRLTMLNTILVLRNRSI